MPTMPSKVWSRYTVAGADGPLLSWKGATAADNAVPRQGTTLSLESTAMSHLEFYSHYPALSGLLLGCTAVLAVILSNVGSLWKGEPAPDHRTPLIAWLGVVYLCMAMSAWFGRPAPASFPESGSVERFAQSGTEPGRPTIVQLSVNDTDSSSKLSLVVTFLTADSGKPILRTFLKEGEGAEVLVPPGNVRVSVEYGATWLGSQQGFLAPSPPQTSKQEYALIPGEQFQIRLALRTVDK